MINQQQIEQIKSLFVKENSIPKLITVLFSFPPLNSDNFRYKKELGGGALLDTGIYAVSIGRCFFDSLPESCCYNKNDSIEGGLEISYSLLMKYPGGRTLIGHFGFNTEYINHLNILSEKINIDVDRIFTVPDNIQNKITVRSKNSSYDIYSAIGNAFELYLKAIFKQLKSGEYEILYSNMLTDAISRNLINKNK